MKFEINFAFCVLVVLSGAPHTEGQSSAFALVLTTAAPTSHTGTWTPPDLTEDPGHEVLQQTHNPAGRNDGSTGSTSTTHTGGTVQSETVTNAVFKPRPQHTDEPVGTPAPTDSASPSAAADSLSSTPTARSTTPLQHVSTTEGRALLTREPLTTFSSQSANASTAQPRSESLTTAPAQMTAPGWGPAGPTHREVPSELNVGDEDLKGSHYRSSSPLDPLLAGLLSVFIVTTAVVFVVLFFKFRQRTNHPEFHRLQDLPMDDLMEDTPLSRYSY